MRISDWSSDVCSSDLLAHALLAGLLLFQQLPLAGDIAAVALRRHVLAQGGDGLARDHLAADGSLDGDIDELARAEILEAFDEHAAARLDLAAVDDDGQRVDRLRVHRARDLHDIALSILVEVVVAARTDAGHH